VLEQRTIQRCRRVVRHSFPVRATLLQVCHAARGVAQALRRRTRPNAPYSHPPPRAAGGGRRGGTNTRAFMWSLFRREQRCRSVRAAPAVPLRAVQAAWSSASTSGRVLRASCPTTRGWPSCSLCKCAAHRSEAAALHAPVCLYARGGGRSARGAARRDRGGASRHEVSWWSPAPPPICWRSGSPPRLVPLVRRARFPATCACRPAARAPVGSRL
jgi:hypothetical protein